MPMSTSDVMALPDDEYTNTSLVPLRVSHGQFLSICAEALRKAAERAGLKVLRCALLSLMLFSSRASEARAAAPPALETRAQLERQANSDMKEGIKLRRAREDEAALQFFYAAYEKLPESARVRAHLALTHQALGHWVDAERYLLETLNASDDPYVRLHHAQLEGARKFVAARLGSLDVVGQPIGAEVMLDGQRRGTLPLTLRVAAGSHTLQVAHSEFQPIERSVVVVAQTLVRETVELTRSAPTPVFDAGRISAPDVGADAHLSGSAPGRRSSAKAAARRWPRSGPWLTATLTGLATSAGVLAATSWWIRERHAARWNSAACLAPERTRGEVCDAERNAGESSERIAVGGAIVSGLLFAGATVSYIFDAGDETDRGSVALTRCSLHWASVGCAGAF
jgi:hypothetical protein